MSATTIVGPAALKPAVAHPRAFGEFLFSRHWLSIEIVSVLLLVILFGVLHLGQDSHGGGGKEGRP